jgi:guanylate kinase
MEAIEQKVLYIIMGASGSGKTSLLQNIVYSQNLCIAAPKYSNRERRPPEVSDDGISMYDDITHLSLFELEEKCDIFYEINNNKYGVNSLEIISALMKQEKGIVLILSNIRAIKLLKRKVEDSGYLVKVIYLLSRMDSANEFIKTWQKRVNDNYKNAQQTKNNESKKIRMKIESELQKYLSIPESNPDLVDIGRVNSLCDSIMNYLPQSESGKKRAEKIRLMFTQYVHNIGVFDYVVLNTTTKNDMFMQAKYIIEHNSNSDNQRLAKHKLLKGPVIFIVCASPKSGKGTLMENLNIMGVSQIQITPKYANREVAINDKRDGMIAKGNIGFNNEFLHKNKKTYWEWSFHTNAQTGEETKYAVKTEDIVKRFNKGICQIFVSNFEQLERVYNDSDITLQSVLSNFKERLVFIYLHRVRTEEEIAKEILDEKRRTEISEIHQKYIKNIVKIDHVIINPNYLTYSEDLHDQIMSLVELYQN